MAPSDRESVDKRSVNLYGRREMVRRTIVAGASVGALATGVNSALATPAGAQSVVLQCDGEEFYNFGSLTSGGRSANIIVPPDCPISYVIFGSGGVAGARVRVNAGTTFVSEGSGGRGGFGARWAGWISGVPVERTLQLHVPGGMPPQANVHSSQPGPTSFSGDGGTSGRGTTYRASQGSNFIYAASGGGGGAGGGATSISVVGETAEAPSVLIVAGAGAGGGGGSAHLYLLNTTFRTQGDNGGRGGDGRPTGAVPPTPGVVQPGTNGTATTGAQPGQGGQVASGGAGGRTSGSFAGVDGAPGGFWIPGARGGGGNGGNATDGNLVHEGAGGGGGGGGGYSGGGGGEGGNGNASAQNRGAAGAGGGSNFEIGSAYTDVVPASLLAQQPPFYDYTFNDIGRGGRNEWGSAGERPAVSGAILIKVGVEEIISDSTGAVLV